jgi:hypothetical protein
MGGAPFSREKINAREIALSSDENRSYQLWSRELQNVLAMGSADPVGLPFSCALSALALTFTSGFQMQLADGDALFYFPTDPSLTVDDSPFEVLRWRSVAPLAFATPDGTNPRIDLVVAQPVSVDADLVSRNILVDPVARTIAAQNVFKTSNPTSIITVVTGTPAGSPVPPAVPSGKCALFEVRIPAAAPDASTFTPAPRLFRRAPFPWSATNGILAGCRLTWDLTVNPATTSSGLTMGGPSSKVIIDGEVIDCSALFGVPVVQDSTANPFGSAAPAGNDRVYYIYAVGGRHAPQGTVVTAGFVPVAIIESTVAPNNLGQPFSPLTTPRGTTTVSGAVYIGIGFVRANTTLRHACIMGPEMTYILGSAEQLSLTKAGAGTESMGVPASKPNVSTRALVAIGVSAASAAATAILNTDRGDGGGISPSVGSPDGGNATCVVKNNSSGSNFNTGQIFFAPGNATIWQAGIGLAAADVVRCGIEAYDHGVVKLTGFNR